MGSKNLAVLIIDMQPFFVEGDIYLNSILKSGKEVIDVAKRKGHPIFVLEYSDKIYDFGKTISPIKNILNGYSNVHFIEKFNENGFIVNRNYHGFTCMKEDVKISGDNHLDLELKKRDVGEIVISGVNKYGCILQTAKEAIQRGYTVLSAHTLMNEQNFDISHGAMANIDYGWHEKNTRHYKKISDLVRYMEK